MLWHLLIEVLMCVHGTAVCLQLLLGVATGALHLFVLSVSHRLLLRSGLVHVNVVIAPITKILLVLKHTSRV